MPILECRRVRFLSQGDEDAFFGLLRANMAIRRMEGIGDTLYLHVPPRLSERSLRELLATFRRYEIPMEQLAQFTSERNRGWFENPNSYWFSEVFGRDRRTAPSNLTMERTAGVKGRGKHHNSRLARGRSSPSR